MAQTGYTPISIYYSSTAGNTPTAGNLVPGELAINTADGKLFYKDSSGVVQTIASKATGTVAGSTTQVIYNNAGAYAGSSNFVFDGTNVGIGTASPSAPLDIQSNSGGTSIRIRGRASANAGAIRYFANDNTTQKARIESNDTSFEINSIASLPITFNTADTERMRIDSSGNVGINLTPASQFSTVRGLGLVGTNGNASYITSGGSQDLVLTSNAYLNTSGNFTYVNTDAVVQQRMTSGVVSWLSATSGTAGTTASLTERMRINANSAILCLAGGNTSATGTGIAFPATQSASSDANTLDDYEEGTWSPSIGGSATYTNQVGKYTKIGNTVTVYYEIGISSVGTGQVYGITNLPFTASIGIVAVTGNHNNVITSHYCLYSYTDTGNTNCFYGAQTAFGGSSATPVPAMQNNTYIRGAFTYFTY